MSVQEAKNRMASNVNIVEIIADDSAFDQPCKFGNRVEGHAVYCHADHWADSPRKCRRTWYTGGETKDEDCPGFCANPRYEGEFNPTDVSNPCSKCDGLRFVKEGKGIETCKHCMGDGGEPEPVRFTGDEQQVIETGILGDDWYVFVGETEEQCNAVESVQQKHCVELRSVTWTRSGAIVYLLRCTEKGKHLLHMFWKSSEYKAEKKNADRRRRTYAKQHRYDPPSKDFVVYGIRMLIPNDSVVIDDDMKFDCENRAVDYFAGRLTAEEVSEAFNGRARKDYEYRIEYINGSVAGVRYHRLEVDENPE